MESSVLSYLFEGGVKTRFIFTIRNTKFCECDVKNPLERATVNLSERKLITSSLGKNLTEMQSEAQLRRTNFEAGLA